MSSKSANTPRKNRLFHSIFLMGSGLAIGCGGVAKLDSVDGSAGDSATTHGGSDNAGGVSSISGGTSTAGTGAMLMLPPDGHGGELSAGAGGSGFASPLPCSPAQWSCSQPPGCTGYDGDLALGADCKCDFSRPTRPADCAPGLKLTCANATVDAAGNRLNPPLPYECACAPSANTTADDCNGACDHAYTAGRFGCEFEVDSSILCYCAVIVVLK